MAPRPAGAGSRNCGNDEKAGTGVVAQAAAQSGVAVEGGEVSEHLAGTGEQHGVAVDQCLIGDVAGERRLADAVGTDQDDVGGVGEEVERHQRLDSGAVATLGPGPVEVGERLEAADMGGAQPALEAAACALLLLPVDQGLDPVGGAGLGPMGDHAAQVEGLGAGLQGIEVTHRVAP